MKKSHLLKMENENAISLQEDLPQSNKFNIVWGKRRLNSFAYFTFALYSFLIAGSSYIYGQKKISTQKYSALSYSISKLKNDISKFDGLREEQNILENNLYHSNQKLKLLEGSLQKSLVMNKALLENSKKQNILAVKKKTRNADQFKQLLGRTNSETLEDPSRTIASIKDLNVNTLRYKQELLVASFKKKQVEDRRIFLSFIDINKEDHKKKYQNFINLQKIDLHKLKQEYSRQRYNRIKNRNI